jgi:hypothetical protein
MHARDLQTILLIQAVEETDRSEEVLAGADRIGATRSALAMDEGHVPSSQPNQPLAPAAEGFLARRAEMLLRKLRSRAPAVGRLLAISDGSLNHERVLLALSFLAGLLVALLAGGRRINLFAYPLLILLIWNLVSYGVQIGRAIRPRHGWIGQFWFGKLYQRWVRRETDALLTHSTGFNAPLAPGLQRFASNWWASAEPLFELRAHWLLHLCAALAAAGLAVGYYYAAGALHNPAGWSGTVLGASSARSVLTAVYGPASFITGIAIPSQDALGMLRWQGGEGGGDALAWVHLMAVTAALYIIVPRLIAAGVSTLLRRRREQELPPPAALVAYTRTLLQSADAA